MDRDFRLRLKFWGVRGSIPTPTAENLGYGGNTTCIEVRTPDDIFVIDMGSGARNFGIALQQEFAATKCSLNVLMTHFHWDHIQGLPFCAPLYSPLNDVTFYSDRTPEMTKEILEGQMFNPYFPVNFNLLAAKRDFIQLNSDPLAKGRANIRAFSMNHPQGATGYRIEVGGAVIVHASDHEHGNPEIDKLLREYAQDADLLVIDSQYTPAEYESRRGWGHSTWLDATNTAKEAKVKQLVLFHHDPAHADTFVDDMVQQAQREFSNTVGAKEGDVFTL